MTSTQAPPPPEGQATTEASATISPLQTRLKWLELLTHLLLLTTVGIFAFTAMTALMRPTARRMLEPAAWQSRPLDDEPLDDHSGLRRKPRWTDDDEPMVPDPHSRPPRALPPPAAEDEESGEKEKVELRAGIVKNDSKLYGKSSERSVEMGEVRAGETVFVMQQSGDWVLVLRGEGAMMGWMRKEDLSAR